MKKALKIAIVAVVAVTGITACTAGPAVVQDATPLSQLPTATIEPSVSVVTTVVTSTVTKPAEPDSFTQVDTRIGYGALKLGMTPEEAEQAGLTGLNWGPNGDATCTGAQKVIISKKYGIARITLPPDAKTSKGIGVGSTVADVKRAYSNAKEFRMGLGVKLTDAASYQFTTYGFRDDDEIVEIKLMSNQTDCAFAAL